MYPSTAMALTILNIAFPLAAVGPDAVGGAEQVVSLLDRTLVAQGHRSIVVATEGSNVSGTLVATPRLPARLDRAAWIAAHEAHRRAIRDALLRWPVDLVHLHGVDFDHYLPPPGPPALVTLHLPCDAYPASALAPARARTYLHCVSRSQRALFPPGTPLLDDVGNGVELEAYRPAARRRGYALAMGRICPQKGFHFALEAAARAGIAFVLAGKVHPFPEHERYHREQVRPWLDTHRRFVGTVHGARKRRLLSGARCVVVSSTVPETCSLVALEALASGTPVVAFRRGALPDVVEHGRTGYLVDSVEEMAEAIRAAATLEGRACRRAAEERFSAAATAGRYLALYRRLTAIDGPPARELAARPSPAPASGGR